MSETASKKKSKPPRIPSPHYMSVKETAAYFCVDETSIRRARGDFARLKQTKLNGRTLILRSSVDDLVYRLDRAAKSAVPTDVESIHDKQRKA